jgi:hypothetical protein
VSPFDFAPGGPVAHVDLGDGTANAPQIRFTAPDESCYWNDFPVTFAIADFIAAAPTDPSDSYQIASFVTPLPSGGAPNPVTQWPFVWAYDPLFGVLQSYHWQIRISFASDASGTVHVGNPISGNLYSANYGIGGFDSGWVTVTTATCSQIGCSNLAVNFGPSFTPFSPFIANTITGGHLQVRWVGGGTDQADYYPCQPYQIFYTPCGGSGDPGIIVCLPANECGVRTVTYNTLATNFNAMGTDVVATILGHGTDLVLPDPTGSDQLCGCFGGLSGKMKVMAGGECTAGVDFAQGD